MKPPTTEKPPVSQWFDSAQLLLSEKRTTLSVLRTGVGIFVLPLSVLGLLIATEKTYQSEKVMHFLLPILIICGFLALLALALIIRALIHLHHYDRVLNQLKESHPVLHDLIG